MRYLLVIYGVNDLYKSHHFYETLEEVKVNHGITSSQSVMDRLHFGVYSSPDGSGSYLIEYDKMEYLFTEYKHMLHFLGIIERSKDFIRADVRRMKLDELDLN